MSFDEPRATWPAPRDSTAREQAEEDRPGYFLIRALRSYDCTVHHVWTRQLTWPDRPARFGKVVSPTVLTG